MPQKRINVERLKHLLRLVAMRVVHPGMIILAVEDVLTRVYGRATEGGSLPTWARNLVQLFLWPTVRLVAFVASVLAVAVAAVALTTLGLMNVELYQSGIVSVLMLPALPISVIIVLMLQQEWSELWWKRRYVMVFCKEAQAGGHSYQYQSVQLRSSWGKTNPTLSSTTLVASLHPFWGSTRADAWNAQVLARTDVGGASTVRIHLSSHGLTKSFRDVLPGC